MHERKVTVSQADKFLKQQKEFYPEHFEIGSHVKVKSMPDLMPGTLIKKLKGTKWKKFTGIYQHYTYFSQYEHFTSKTIDIMLNDRNKEFKTFTVAVDFLLIGLLANVATIGLAPKFIDDLNRISNEYKLKFVDKK